MMEKERKKKKPATIKIITPMEDAYFDSHIDQSYQGGEI